MEDIRIQELQDHDARLFIASAAEPSYRAKPRFTLQLLSGDSLDDVQKLLCDEAFKLAKGLLRKDRLDLLLLFRWALAQNQFSSLCKQGRGRVLEPLFNASLR